MVTAVSRGAVRMIEPRLLSLIYTVFAIQVTVPHQRLARIYLRPLVAPRPPRPPGLPPLPRVTLATVRTASRRFFL